MHSNIYSCLYRVANIKQENIDSHAAWTEANVVTSLQIKERKTHLLLLSDLTFTEGCDLCYNKKKVQSLLRLLGGLRQVRAINWLEHFRLYYRLDALAYCSALCSLFVLFSDLSKILTSADQHRAQTIHFSKKRTLCLPLPAVYIPETEKYSCLHSNRWEKMPTCCMYCHKLLQRIVVLETKLLAGLPKQTEHTADAHHGPPQHTASESCESQQFIPSVEEQAETDRRCSISRTESDKSRFDRSMVETWGAEFHKTTAGSHKSDPSSSPSEYSLQQQNQRNT